VGERATAQEAEILRIQAGSANHAAESDARLRKVEEELARSRQCEFQLQAHLDQARAELRASSEAQAQLSEARAEVDRLLRQIESVGSRADAIDRLEAELQSANAETELVHTQLQAARTSLRQFDPQVVEAMARDLATLRDERDLLRDDLQALRSELEARSVAAAADPRDKELGALRVERDRLNAEQQASSGREERLRDRIRELERSLLESTASCEMAQATFAGQLEEARAAWDSERQAIQRESEERIRTQVRDGERRLSDEQARAMAVQKQALQQRDEERRRWDQELDSVREETERLRIQLQARNQESNELAGRAKALVQERAAAIEQAEARRRERDQLAAARDEAEAALHEAAQRCQAENDRLRQALETARDQADLAARDLSADLERRLAEALERLRTQTERADQMEAEYLAVCQSLDGSYQSVAGDASDHGDSSSRSPIPAAAEHDRSLVELRVGELTEQLNQCRGANERLRSLLKVVGLVEYLGE
jgi:chromosome segregation ATPase